MPLLMSSLRPSPTGAQSEPLASLVPPLPTSQRAGVENDSAKPIQGLDSLPFLACLASTQ